MSSRRKKYLTNSTHMVREQDVKHDWFVLDAEGKTLGRFAAEVAKVLRGKHKPDFTPHVDSGGGVIVLNAEKICVTGAKAAQKEYHSHSGKPGHQKSVPYRRMLERKPTEIIRLAVKGMLPKTRLGRQQMKRLRLFVGSEHTMQAQQPTPVSL